MFPYGWFLLGLLILVTVILLEAWRQWRKLERSGARPEERASLIGAGVLELQRLLQPDRKVEQMLAETKDRDRVNPEHRREDAAAGDQAGE